MIKMRISSAPQSMGAYVALAADAVVVAVAVVVAFAAVPSVRAEPDYATMSYVDLLVEMNKTIPENESRRGSVFENIEAFTCRDHCGKLTSGLCSCRPTCQPAGNCCPDFRVECPLQYQRLESDLWWLSHLVMTCHPTNVMAVSSCPAFDSAIHADRFKQASESRIARAASRRVGGMKNEAEEAAATGNSDPHLKMFKKRHADFFERLKSESSHVDDVRERKRRRTDDHAPSRGDHNATEHSSKPKTPMFPDEGGNDLENTRNFFNNEEPTEHLDIVFDTTETDEGFVSTTPTFSESASRAQHDSGVDKFRQALAGLPVSDLDTGLVFINASVFACHSHLVSSPVQWEAVFVADTREVQKGSVLQQAFVDMDMRNELVAIPPTPDMWDLELCQTRATNSCPKEYEDQTVVQRCKESISIVVYMGRPFLNPFCVFCRFEFNNNIALSKLILVPPYLFQKNKFQTFHITMTLNIGQNMVNFVSSTFDANSRDGIYPNWQQYSCRLEEKKSVALSSGASGREGEDDSDNDRGKNEGKDNLGSNALMSLVDLREKPIQMDGCEVQSCRVGKIQDNVCEVQVYWSIRLPQSSKPLCHQYLEAIVSELYRFVNTDFVLIKPLSVEVHLLGVGRGHYIYQVDMISRSVFDMMKAYEIMSSAISVMYFLLPPFVINGNFCASYGIYSDGQVPKHALYDCLKENSYYNVPTAYVESNVSVTIICSGQARLHKVWMLGVIFLSSLIYSFWW